jgi:hypothetical protein
MPRRGGISLGLKQVESNPWHELAEKYPVGHEDHGQGAQPDGVRRLSSRWKMTSTA